MLLLYYLRQTGSKSSIKPVNIGVPQGSLLGPVLWNIYVDDMPAGYSRAIKYADDTTTYTPVTRSTNMSTLQEAANEINTWSVENKLTLNTKKTKTMILNLRKPPQLPDININGAAIENVKTFKLLGVHIDDRLTFADHVHHTTSKGRSKCHALTKLKRARLCFLSV